MRAATACVCWYPSPGIPTLLSRFLLFATPDDLLYAVWDRFAHVYKEQKGKGNCGLLQWHGKAKQKKKLSSRDSFVGDQGIRNAGGLYSVGCTPERFTMLRPANARLLFNKESYAVLCKIVLVACGNTPNSWCVVSQDQLKELCDMNTAGNSMDGLPSFFTFSKRRMTDPLDRTISDRSSTLVCWDWDVSSLCDGEVVAPRAFLDDSDHLAHLHLAVARVVTLQPPFQMAIAKQVSNEILLYHEIPASTLKSLRNHIQEHPPGPAAPGTASTYNPTRLTTSHKIATIKMFSISAVSMSTCLLDLDPMPLRLSLAKEVHLLKPLLLLVTLVASHLHQAYAPHLHKIIIHGLLMNTFMTRFKIPMHLILQEMCHPVNLPLPSVVKPILMSRKRPQVYWNSAILSTPFRVVRTPTTS